MNKHLIRIVSFVLVPCFLADLSLASADFTFQRKPWQKSVVNFGLFSEQAMSNRAVIAPIQEMDGFEPSTASRRDMGRLVLTEALLVGLGGFGTASAQNYSFRLIPPKEPTRQGPLPFPERFPAAVPPQVQEMVNSIGQQVRDFLTRQYELKDGKVALKNSKQEFDAELVRMWTSILNQWMTPVTSDLLARKLIKLEDIQDLRSRLADRERRQATFDYIINEVLPNYFALDGLKFQFQLPIVDQIPLLSLAIQPITSQEPVNKSLPVFGGKTIRYELYHTGPSRVPLLSDLWPENFPATDAYSMRAFATQVTSDDTRVNLTIDELMDEFSKNIQKYPQLLRGGRLTPANEPNSMSRAFIGLLVHSLMEVTQGRAATISRDQLRSVIESLLIDIARRHEAIHVEDISHLTPEELAKIPTELMELRGTIGAPVETQAASFALAYLIRSAQVTGVGGSASYASYTQTGAGLILLSIWADKNLQKKLGLQIPEPANSLYRLQDLSDPTMDQIWDAMPGLENADSSKIFTMLWKRIPLNPAKQSLEWKIANQIMSGAAAAITGSLLYRHYQQRLRIDNLPRSRGLTISLWVAFLLYVGLMSLFGLQMAGIWDFSSMRGWLGMDVIPGGLVGWLSASGVGLYVKLSRRGLLAGLAAGAALAPASAMAQAGRPPRSPQAIERDINTLASRNKTERKRVLALLADDISNAIAHDHQNPPVFLEKLYGNASIQRNLIDSILNADSDREPGNQASFIASVFPASVLILVMEANMEAQSRIPTSELQRHPGLVAGMDILSGGPSASIALSGLLIETIRRNQLRKLGLVLSYLQKALIKRGGPVTTDTANTLMWLMNEMLLRQDDFADMAIEDLSFGPRAVAEPALKQAQTRLGIQIPVRLPAERPLLQQRLQRIVNAIRLVRQRNIAEVHQETFELARAELPRVGSLFGTGLSALAAAIFVIFGAFDMDDPVDEFEEMVRNGTPLPSEVEKYLPELARPGLFFERINNILVQLLSRPYPPANREFVKAKVRDLLAELPSHPYLAPARAMLDEDRAVGGLLEPPPVSPPPAFDDSPSTPPLNKLPLYMVLDMAEHGFKKWKIEILSEEGILIMKKLERAVTSEGFSSFDEITQFIGKEHTAWQNIHRSGGGTTRRGFAGLLGIFFGGAAARRYFREAA